jgi:hypothetical protein
MNIDLRIPVTAEQKQVIMDAIADEPAGFAAWAREVLLKAAAKKTSVHKSIPVRAGGIPDVS